MQSTTNTSLMDEAIIEQPALNRAQRRFEARQRVRKPKRNLPLGFEYDKLPRSGKVSIFYAGLKAVREAREDANKVRISK